MTRWRRVAFCVCFGAIVILGLALSAVCVAGHLPYFGLYHDDALYVVTAKSLAEGNGYRILSLPDAPWQTKYPILYPLLLSAVWRLNPIFPYNLLFIEWLNVLLGLSFGLFAVLYLLRTRRISLGIAVVIAGATVLNIKFLSFLPMSMSDSTFALLSVATLWTAELTARLRSRGIGGAFLLGILETLATLARGTGVCLAPVTTIYLLLWGQLKRALLSLGVFLALAGPYWYWVRTHQSVPSPSMVYYTSHSRWASESYRDLGLPRVVAHKAHDVFHSVHQLVWPMLGQVPYDRLSPLEFFLVYRVGYVTLWLVLLAGILTDLLNRQRRLLPLYFLAYAAGTLVWPGWFEWRIALVVLPFFYYFYYRGFRLMASAVKTCLRSRQRRLWGRFCSTLAVCFGVYLIFGSAWSSICKAGHYPRRLPFRADITRGDELADAQAAYEWIRTNTPPAAVVVSNNDPLVYLCTGRRGLQPSPYQGWRVHGTRLITPASLVEVISESGASYVLLDPTYGAAYQAHAQMALSLAELNRSVPNLLRAKYASPHGVMILFEVNQKAVGEALNKYPAEGRKSAGRVD